MAKRVIKKKREKKIGCSPKLSSESSNAKSAQGCQLSLPFLFTTIECSSAGYAARIEHVLKLFADMSNNRDQMLPLEDCIHRIGDVNWPGLDHAEIEYLIRKWSSFDNCRNMFGKSFALRFVLSFAAIIMETGGKETKSSLFFFFNIDPWIQIVKYN